MSHHTLNPAEAERLEILAEECAEVIQRVNKILRHGYASHHPSNPEGPNNRVELERELGDVRAAVLLLTHAKDVDEKLVHAYQMAKLLIFAEGNWLHHQDPNYLLDILDAENST